MKVNQVHGDLLQLGEQCRRAVAWVYQHADQFDADPSRIFVSGHSAGAHLAAVVATTRWSNYGLPDDLVKHVLCVSGMFDLYPVSLSSRNEYVAFTEQIIEKLSPIRNLGQLSAQTVVAYGSGESPEFKRQSIDFHAALQRENKTAHLIKVEQVNHFEISEQLGNPDSELGRITLELMGLTG